MTILNTPRRKKKISKARDQSCTNFQQSTGPGSTKPSQEPALIQNNCSSCIPGTPQQKTINGVRFCPVQSALATVLNGLLHTNAGLDSICACFFFFFILPFRPLLFFLNGCRKKKSLRSFQDQPPKLHRTVPLCHIARSQP